MCDTIISSSILYSRSESIEYPSLILLDFDDTLFPTTWFQSKSETAYTEEELNDINDYLRTVNTFISSLKTKTAIEDDIIIFTNAESDWVKFAFDQIRVAIPEQLRNCPVISAREYSVGTRLTVDYYKSYALRVYHDEFDIFNHIISIGDSIYERDAVINLKSHKKHLRIKTIKFVERPTIRQLINQLKYMTDYFDMIYKASVDLDGMISIHIADMLPTPPQFICGPSPLSVPSPPPKPLPPLGPPPPFSRPPTPIPSVLTDFKSIVYT